jgi:hypothetical protein
MIFLFQSFVNVCSEKVEGQTEVREVVSPVVTSDVCNLISLSPITEDAGMILKCGDQEHPPISL